MDKELIDQAWACLPREFKEEVKKEYRKGYVCETLAMLITLFGHHNLTSDAEGEEMLTVSRKQVQEVYNKYAKYVGFKLQPLLELFDSKCLPDEAPLSQNPAANCDTESHISTDCDKPSEPKFYIGQRVRCLNDGETYIVLAKAGKHHYSLQGVEHDVHEDYLEPYAEPTENLISSNSGELNPQEADNQFRNLSQETANCDKQFDNILKDSFAKERRLKIAAMMAQGIIANSDEVYRAETCSKAQETPKAVAEYALALTDALIAECEAKH